MSALIYKDVEGQDLTVTVNDIGSTDLQTAVSMYHVFNVGKSNQFTLTGNVGNDVTAANIYNVAGSVSDWSNLNKGEQTFKTIFCFGSNNTNCRVVSVDALVVDNDLEGFEFP